MIRVLYLHGLRGSSSTRRRGLLEEACQPNPVKVPNLKTRQTLIIFTVVFTLFVFCVVAFDVLAWLYLSLISASCVTVGLVLVVWLAYILAGRGVTQYIVVKATKIAEDAFWDFRPNVIVASSFGSILVFRMNVPKVSLILLSPAQDAYCRHFDTKELPTLEGYPYVIVIHGGYPSIEACYQRIVPYMRVSGSNDDEISLDDSIRLVDCSAYVQCKLEVIEDTHELSTLSAGDYKEFIEEAYDKGRQHVLEMKKGQAVMPLRKRSDGQKPAVPAIDPTLFFIATDDHETEPTGDNEVNEQLSNTSETSSVLEKRPSSPASKSSTSAQAAAPLSPELKPYLYEQS